MSAPIIERTNAEATSSIDQAYESCSPAQARGTQTLNAVEVDAQPASTSISHFRSLSIVLRLIWVVRCGFSLVIRRSVECISMKFGRAKPSINIGIVRNSVGGFGLEHLETRTVFAVNTLTSLDTPFTENFDGMGSSTTATIPSLIRISSSAGATDYSGGLTATANAAGTSGTGALTGSSGGNHFNYASGVTASSTDRSIGFLTSGSYSGPRSIIAAVTNNTGSTISALDISYDYEKYRSGTRSWDMTFFHGSSSIPTISATAGDHAYAADGANAVVNPPTTTSKSFTLSGLSIPNGTTYYLRWTYAGNGGQTNSQGIGLDNLSITARAAVPPSISGATTAAAFATTYGTASTEQSFPVSGNNLTTDLVATAPTGFEVSSGGAYGATATFTQANGSASGTLSVRLKANASVAGTYDSQNIVLATTGATTNIATAASGNTVTAAPLTITGLTASNKTYNANTTGSLSGTPAYLGLVNGESFSVTGTASASFADKNVGTAKPVTVTGYTAPSSNYTISQPSGLTADVTAASLTLTGLTAGNRVYDTSTSANVTGTALLSGVIGSDEVTLSGSASGSFANKNVGTAKPVTVSGFSISGADSGNYTLTQPTLSADIAAAPLTISGVNAVSRVYDATTIATLSGTASLDGVQGSDVVTLGGSPVASFATKIVETGKAVTVTGYTIGGDDAGNYTVSQPTSLTADISKASLAVSITSSGKVYDGSDAAAVNYAFTPAIFSGDVVTATGTAVYDLGKSIGVDKAITASGISIEGIDAANYLLSNTSATTTATITAKALTATATVNTKTYDAGTSTTGLAIVLDGIVGSETVTATGSASFATKTAGTAKLVNVTGITLAGDDFGNYTVNPTTTTNADISKATLVGSVTVADKTFDNSTSATIVTRTLATVLGTDDVTYGGGTANFDTSEVGDNKTVTVTGLSLSGADNDNYLVNLTATTTASITAATGTAQTITFTNPGPKTYGVAAFALGATASSGLTVSYEVLSGPATVSNDILTITGAGTVVVRASQAGDSTYAVAPSVQQSFSVAVKTLTPTLTYGGKVYDGNTSVTGATLGLDGVINGDVVTISGDSAILSSEDVGSRTASVSGLSIAGAGAGNYVLGSASVSTSAAVTAKALTLVAVNPTKIYDGLTSDVTVTIAPGGFASGESALVTALGSYSSKNVGTQSVTLGGLSFADAAGGFEVTNYSFTAPTAATLTTTQRALTVTATGVSKEYDGLTSATVTLGDDRVSGDVLTLAYSTANFTGGKSVGNAKPIAVSGITVTGDDSGNYTFNDTASASASITAKALLVTAVGVNKTYDGTVSATVTLNDDRISGDALTLTYSAVFTDSKNVGTAKPIDVSSISVTGADADNYTFNTTASANADVTARSLAVTATGVNKVYNGDASATVTLSSDQVVGDSLVLAFASATFDAGKNVGTAKAITASGISVTGDDASNYSLVSTTATASANITAASITVSATGVNKTYDATTAATVTYSFDGLIGADVVTATGTATFADKSVGIEKAISVTGITLDGTDGGNYSPNMTATTAADVTVLAITGSITISNKNYDGTTSATIATRTLSGVLASDVVTYTGGTATFADALIGSGKAVTASGLSLTGADAGNYTVNTSASVNADILAAPIATILTSWSFDSITPDALVSTGNVAPSTGSGSVSVTGSVAQSFATGSPSNATGDNSGYAITTFPAASAASGTAGVRFNVPTNTGAGATATGLVIAFDFRQSGTASRFWQLQLSSDGTNFVNASGGTATFASAPSPNVTGSTSFTSAGLYSNNAGSGSQNYVLGLSYSLDGNAAASYVNNPNFAWRFVSVFDPANNTSYTGSNSTYSTGSTARFDNVAVSVTANLASTISVIASGKTYDGIAVTGSATVSGGAAGGTGSTGAVTYTYYNGSGGNNGTNTVLAGAPSNAGDYSVVASVAADSIYAAATSAPADFTIGKVALAATATATSKSYDGNATATVSINLAGIVSGEEGDVSAFGTGTFDTKNVGPGKQVDVTGINLSGAKAGNYTVNPTATTTADVSAIALTATIASTGKTYDGSNSATVSYTLGAGVLSGETVTVNGISANYDSKNVGAGKTITANGIALAGADAGNYTVNPSATTTADITAKVLTATIASAGKVYDGTDSATVTYSLAAGVVDGETVTVSGTSASYDTKNAGTGKTITASGIELGGADASNYTVNGTATTTADISKIALTATITATNKVYDRLTSASVSFTLGAGVLSGETVSVSGSAAFADKNVGLGKTITASVITLNGDDAANYSVNETATTTADITALAITGSVTINNKAFDGNNSATIATRTLSGVISGDVVSYVGGTATFDDVTGAIGSGKNVSITGLSLDGADAGNYSVDTFATATADITNAAQSQTITFAPLGDKTYGDASFDLAATASSGLAVSFSIVSGPATLAGNTLTITGAGTVVVEATQAGNASFTTATPVQQSFTVAKKTLTTTITGTDREYDRTTAASVTIDLVGVVDGDLVTATGTAVFATKNAGLAKSINVSGITLDGVDSSNYSVSATGTATANITAVELTASGTAASRVYNANTDAAVTISLTGVISGDSVTGSATGTFGDKNVGTGKTVTIGTVTLAGDDAANYTVGSAGTAEADITAFALTASGTAASRTYDATTDAVVTISLTGVFGGDSVTGSASGSFANKNVGTGKTVTIGTVDLSGGDAANYTVGSAGTATADISAYALTATGTAANRAYDATTNAEVTISLTGVFSGESVTGSASGSFATKNVGTAKTVTIGIVTLAGDDAANYSVGSAGTATADITTFALTASGTASSRTYNGTTDAAVAISLAGVFSGDSVTGSATGSFVNKNVGTGKTVTIGTVTLLGTDAANYTVGSAGATTADISVLSVSPAISASSKIYNATSAATVTYSVTGAISGDDVTASGTASFADKDVGAGKLVSASSIVLSGADLANYALTSSTATTTADITAFAITGSITAQDKSFDGTTSATIATRTLDGVLAGDVVSYSGGTATFDTAAVGTGKTVTAVGLSLSGADALNYSVNSTATTTASIAAVNNPPVFTNISPSFSLFNKSVAATVVGTVAATDSDVGQTLTYSLSGTGAAAFAISNTGVITVANATLLKTLSSPVTLTVRATDNGPTPAFAEATATILLKSANTAPTFAGTDSTSSVIAIAGGKATITMVEQALSSSTANGSLVGTLTVTDADEAIGTVFTIAMDTDKTGAFQFNSSTGQITVKDASKLDFEKTSAFKLSFNVTDNGLTGLTGKKSTSKLAVTVNLTDANDAPTISFKPSKSNPLVGANVGQTVLDNKTVAPFASAIIFDADKLKTTSPDQVTVTVSLDDAAKGAFTAASLTKSGFAAGATAGTYTYTGTAKAATSAISKLMFKPAENRVAVAATETTTFTIRVNDGVAPVVIDSTTTVIATSVNNLPTVTGTVAGQSINDTQTTNPFSGVTIGDLDVVDGGGQQVLSVTVALDKTAKGVFTPASLTASGFAAGATAGTYVFSGTAAQATSAIRLLDFDPTENLVKPLKTDTTKFSITVTDPIVGSKPVVNKIASVITTSVNDDATITGVTTTAQTVTDKTQVNPFSTVVIGDVDSGAKVTVTITLDLPASGALVGAFKLSKTPGVYTFTGTPSAATLAIQALSFKPTANFAAPGATTTTGFTISVKDTDSAAATINVATSVVTTSVNDAPTIGGTKAGAKVDTGKTVLPFTKVLISDVDNQSVTVTVSLDNALKGSFTPASLTSSGFVAGSVAGTYTFTGTGAAAQVAIRKLAFQPTAGRVAKGITETTTLTITVDDGIAPVVTDSVTTVISKQVS